MTQTFHSREFLDEYDYRIWHKSGGNTFYKDVSCESSMTSCCWLLHTLIAYDRSRGVEYENQGLQVALTGTDDWFEFTFTDGRTIKHVMGTAYTQKELL